MSEKDVVRFESWASDSAATLIAERSMKFAACDCAFNKLSTSSRNSASSLLTSTTNASRLSGGWASAWSSNASTFFQRSGSISLIGGKLAIEPGFRFIPFAHDRDGRNLHHFRCLFDTQSAEETQLHNLTLAFVDRSETFQSF